MRGIELPPRGSVQSAVMEEMIHRERVREWKSAELQVLNYAFQATRNEKLFEELAGHVSNIMSMALHMPEAYQIAEKPSPDVDDNKLKSDQEYLELLNNMPQDL
ncbi:hypothetical protein CMI47_19755 [Candidatus Pacearchaeota archaeon]|nr:hypothetical protein [Candidatus Pacearchaeota archaeon]